MEFVYFISDKTWELGEFVGNRLSNDELCTYFCECLSEQLRTVANAGSKPFEVDLTHPYRALRVYLFNITKPPGGRPSGECKIQLIINGQGRGERVDFDWGDDYFVLLAGYDSHLDCFVLWDATLYKDFSYSRNVQVKNSTIIEAAGSGISQQKRKTKNGEETIIAVTSRNLFFGIQRRRDIHIKQILAG